jgi:RNA polymerase sigma-70 factor (ECF subfamily)
VFGRARTKPERDAQRDVQGNVPGIDVDRAAVQAAKRHPQRFAVLYRKYLPQVYSFAFYELGNHHDAEDVTERVFLSALSALPRFEERDTNGSTFRVWLFRIARNAISNQRRALSRRREAPAALAEHLPGEFQPDGVVLRREEHAEAWAAVARLPADRRRAVILRFVEEMPTAEIAAVMERSEGAVRVLLHRALRSVARDLGRGSAS